VELFDLLLREFPEQFELAMAHLQKAESLVELGEPGLAISEFRLSLECQRKYPHVGTPCWLVFPFFVARRELVDLYDEALAVLDEFKAPMRLTFPIERYRYTAARALIAGARQDAAMAREFAKAALEAAAAEHSGFRRHPDVGLVEAPASDVQSRLNRLAGG
jgi:hypothetical protein